MARVIQISDLILKTITNAELSLPYRQTQIHAVRFSVTTFEVGVGQPTKNIGLSLLLLVVRSESYETLKPVKLRL